MLAKYKDGGTNHEVKRWIMTETSMLSVRNWSTVCVCMIFLLIL
jgi:hypothetical protein